MVCFRRKVKLGLVRSLVKFPAIIGKGSNLILLFHRVDNNQLGMESGLRLDVSLFECIIKNLVKKYNIISLEELVDCIKGNARLPRHSVVLTFDDGYKSVYTNAFPILKKYNVPATVFLTTSFIGSKEVAWWDKLEYAIGRTKARFFVVEVRGKKKRYKITGLRSRYLVFDDLLLLLKR